MDNLINVQCRTNIDQFIHEKWPERMVCAPRIGDYVESGSGVRLVICALTHTSYPRSGIYYLEVELTSHATAQPFKGDP